MTGVANSENAENNNVNEQTQLLESNNNNDNTQTDISVTDTNVISPSLAELEEQSGLQDYLATPPTTQETDPLLAANNKSPNARPENSNTDNGNENENEEVYNDDDNMSRVLRLARRPSFIWVCCLGIVALIIFQLTFLPRTSLARDYRNWHGIRLTKTDVKRHYLQMTGIGKSQNTLTTEEYIDSLLKNFTDINQQSSYNLMSQDNPKLTEFVISGFTDLKAFQTQVVKRKVNIGTPESSSVKLFDEQDKTIYIPSLLELDYSTPAYFALGKSGHFVGEYVFVNYGYPRDYSLLLDNNVDVKDKVVIIKSSYRDSNITICEKIAIAEHHGAKAVLSYYDIESDYNSFGKDKVKLLKNAITRGSLLNNTKIPAIPISQDEIKPILNTFAFPGNGPYSNWEFAPTTTAKYKLQVDTRFANSEEPKEFTNIVGTIKGIINDADIVIGARRDSYTSSNPLSGHAVLLEIMRYYQKLVNVGWKPLRNIKFVSWDASYLNLLGVESFINDTTVFNPKRTIVAYISIDGDAVTGSKFAVDANAVFNSVLRRTAKSIPIPKESVSYTNKMGEHNIGDDDVYITDNKGNNNNNNNNDNDILIDNFVHNDFTTLYRYWWKQDKTSINNNLGLPIDSTESMIFQKHLATPIINVRFENDPEHDKAIYIPNSNYYSYDWLIHEKVDDDLLLHGLLIRFIGLLGISLTEHEVYDYKTHAYFKTISTYYKQFKAETKESLSKWDDLVVPNYLIFKSTIFQDLDTNEPVKFRQITHQFNKLMDHIVNQTTIFDKWNENVEDGLMQDYPWYMYYKKLQHYAEYKVSNYKLAYLENDLQLNDRDYLYLKTGENGDIIDVPNYYYDSIIYGQQSFNPNESNQEFFDKRYLHGTFTYLYQSIQNEDFEFTVKWFVMIYEKLNNIDYKMT